MMKGLELAEKYYDAYGREMLAKFPELKNQFSAGLVGRGSECFGFDDEISRDHDYGPSFCVWLDRKQYEKYGGQLQKAYEMLPREFLGFPGRVCEETGQGRVGILCTEDFYYGLLGTCHVPGTNREWLSLQEENLATATNGAVFEDGAGAFGRIREGLLAYYPEDVRRKKIVARLAKAARAGQYNYVRAMQRGERVAAELFLQEFIREIMSLVYLFNRQYAPFVKWMHKGMKNLATCSEIGDMILLFYQVKEPEKAWENGSLDDRVLIIEAICNIIVQELNAQGLSDLEDNFLQSHLAAVTEKIEDQTLRAMQFLEG